MPGACALERLAEHSQLGRASDEGGKTTGGGDLEPSTRRRGTEKLEHFDGLGHPLHRDSTERLDLNVSLDESQRPDGSENRAGSRHLLEARSEVGRLPHGAVVHAQVVPDRPDDHLARVQTDTELEWDSVAPPAVLAEARRRLLQLESRVARPNRVVLVAERGAEDRHDPVTHDLVHGALELVDGVHHDLEGRIEDRPCLLGIEVVEQLHRTFDVGKQYGDLLSFTLERALRREDPLCQMPRRV
jgi:hypothetical protein